MLYIIHRTSGNAKGYLSRVLFHMRKIKSQDKDKLLRQYVIFIKSLFQTEMYHNLQKQTASSNAKLIQNVK